MIGVGGADQGEIPLVGNGKDDPAIDPLEEIAAVVIIQLAGHDMAAPYQAHAVARIDARDVADHVLDPRAGGIDQHPRVLLAGLAGLGILQRDAPDIPLARRRFNPRARHDAGAARLGIAGIQHHQARILDPAVGILIRLGEPRLQRAAGRICFQIDGARRWQDLAPAHVIVHEQAQPDQPCGPPPLHPRHHDVEQLGGGRFPLETHVGVIRQHETHRPTDVRHRAEQHFAFDQRLAHEAEFEIFQVAQPAVKQLGRSRGRRRGQVVHLGQRHRQPAPRRVARDSAAVDAATDDEQIDHIPVLRVRRHFGLPPRFVTSKQPQTAPRGQRFCFRFLSFLTLTRKYDGFSTPFTPLRSEAIRPHVA